MTKTIIKAIKPMLTGNGLIILILLMMAYIIVVYAVPYACNASYDKHDKMIQLHKINNKYL